MGEMQKPVTSTSSTQHSLICQNKNDKSFIAIDVYFHKLLNFYPSLLMNAPNQGFCEESETHMCLLMLSFGLVNFVSGRKMFISTPV